MRILFIIHLLILKSFNSDKKKISIEGLYNLNMILSLIFFIYTWTRFFELRHIRHPLDYKISEYYIFLFIIILALITFLGLTKVIKILPYKKLRQTKLAIKIVKLISKPIKICYFLSFIYFIIMVFVNH
jgi:hypothetical protein